jgi:ABC-type anion transport system duplicated permease subunit
MASTAPSPTWLFRLDAVPHTVLGHVCRVIILAIVAFVHLVFAGPSIVTHRRLDYLFVRIVAPKP